MIDGETLQLGQQRIQLSGIDAPESDQYCLADGARWPCGQQATKALKNYIGLRPVNCWGVDRDNYGRLLAVCFLAGESLNGWLVSQGWALAYRHFSDAYVEEEATAKADGRGMWRGQFIEPWNWRRGTRFQKGTRFQEKVVPAAKECVIKGTINGKGKKIYHLTDQQFYALVNVDEAKGERWFCTEDEARAAGWQPASQ